MSITDELRKWADTYLKSTMNDMLNNIADRIDAKHEKVIRELNNLADACVLLPKDANGEYIHIGDVMEPNGSNLLFGQASFDVRIEVRAMRCDEGGWEVYNRLGDRYAPSLLRHHHEQTVEDVLREFGDKYCDMVTGSDKESELFAEYATKLQLKGIE